MSYCARLSKHDFAYISYFNSIFYWIPLTTAYCLFLIVSIDLLLPTAVCCLRFTVKLYVNRREIWLNKPVDDLHWLSTISISFLVFEKMKTKIIHRSLFQTLDHNNAFLFIVNSISAIFFKKTTLQTINHIGKKCRWLVFNCNTEMEGGLENLHWNV